ncbi:hypothetical protein GCM10027575_27440 [Phytohabitans suffuscus]
MAGRVLADDDHDVADAGQRGHRGLDLAQLDAVAADLHLVVDPADELQRAVGAAAGDVAAAVQAGAGRAGRVGYEPLGGELGPAEVAAGHAGAADVDLAGDADRHRAAGGVEQVDAEVGQGVADRAGVRPLQVGGDHAVVGHVDGRLGDAVHVQQAGPVQVAPRDPGAELAVLQPLPAEDHRAQREPVDARVAVGGEADQAAERGRGLVEHGDALRDEQVQEELRRPGDLGGHDDQAAAVEQRAPQLPDGEVEGVRVEQRPHVVGPEPVVVLGDGHEPQDVGVGDADALGLAGGAGGVDDVREVVGPGRGVRLGGRRGADLRVVGEDHGAAEGREPLPVRLGGDDDADAGVGEHEVDPLGR